jgi:hypothetical protein
MKIIFVMYILNIYRINIYILFTFIYNYLSSLLLLLFILFNFFFYFKGVFSKAAKAIRECETLIRNAKEAMKLKGVGKGVAGYIEEMLTTGKINKLEELRAGTA